MEMRVLQILSNFLRLAAFGGVLATGAQAQDASGAYLAARQAAMAHDYQPASQYFARALSQSPQDMALVAQAMSAFLAVGDVGKAQILAKMLASSSQTQPLAEILQLAVSFQAQDYDAALAQLEMTSVAGTAIDDLLKGWALMGLGQVGDALTLFDAAANAEGMRSFALYQKALALSLVGDFNSAESIFSGKDQTPAAISFRGSLVRAQILLQLGRSVDAISFLNDFHGEDADQEVLTMIAQLEAGVAVDFDMVRNGSEGAGEVLFFLAMALKNGEGYDDLLLYTRLASHMAPRNVHALLLSAQLLEELGNPSLAIETYDAVPRSHPAFVSAELGRARAMYGIGKAEMSIEVLEQLAESFPEVRRVHETLGNFLRQEGNFSLAVQSYDTAIAMIDQLKPSHWYIHYARGIAHDRLGAWERGMRDFDQALVLSPDQFQVLNYVGYSLVERGEMLEEALSMIQRAVAVQPTAGYIIDSLGWVQYRLGYYQDAVVQLERAVELMTTDPIVNDHLGDVYWAVGRKAEALFQWRRALSFANEIKGHDDIDPVRVQLKLDIGLDAVLAEEGAPPLQVADGY
jgi:tetratricopeptide (TPR) repeat protein|tara:strand:+ start:7 stop:1731 length:1725 start_codon:yes stop_codon:yes gene_type:complete